MYAKCIVIVMLSELLLTILTVIGAYFGLTFPLSISLGGGGPESGQPAFRAVLPMWMPALSDLNMPYSYLKTNDPSFAPSAIFLAVTWLVQSYARAVYLGALKGAVLREPAAPLRVYGRRYFKPMAQWTAFQLLITFCAVSLFPVIGPLTLVAAIGVYVFSPAPYLVVLYDSSFSWAMTAAPRVFRFIFRRMLAFALFAMLVTGIVSTVVSLPKPLDYYFALLVYSTVGTSLLAEFMRRFVQLLRENGEPVVRFPHDAPSGERTRWRTGIAAVLIVLLPACGAWIATGYPAAAIGRIVQSPPASLPGVSFYSAFSTVLPATDYRYDGYSWGTKPYRIDISLPDMSDGKRPGDIRGSATVVWDVDVEKVIRSGSGSVHHAEAVPATQTVLFRLVRERSEDGSFYYSSRRGFAEIANLRQSSREPLSVEMALSGDGRHLFVLQHPSRFEAEASFRLSRDGRYAVPKASRMNPDDFVYYWFARDLRKNDVFDMLQAKNEYAAFGPNRLDLPLAVALQEADGAMVVRILNSLKASGVKLTVPNMTEREWTERLRGQYEGAELFETLDYLSKTGGQLTYVPAKLPSSGDGSGGKASVPKPEADSDAPESYRLDVPFPHGPITMLYTFNQNRMTELELRLSDH
ncbi:hypothetical protein [Paenibacillus flagellatus]|uniref:Uncharacterized protein n=1 Tax=Paenibacillus flagellatus TaxID=2211139 RepID=A0A2V5KAL6_9BACL|nr:hypothetical protein [Paenibacillus flagellatus]PYI56629.1 hypothetical protein DLM86_06585 [Paenibacillus flagellatus]